MLNSSDARRLQVISTTLLILYMTSAASIHADCYVWCTRATQCEVYIYTFQDKVWAVFLYIFWYSVIFFFGFDIIFFICSGFNSQDSKIDIIHVDRTIEPQKKEWMSKQHWDNAFSGDKSRNAIKSLILNWLPFNIIPGLSAKGKEFTYSRLKFFSSVSSYIIRHNLLLRKKKLIDLN